MRPDNAVNRHPHPNPLPEGEGVRGSGMKCTHPSCSFLQRFVTITLVLSVNTFGDGTSRREDREERWFPRMFF